jgi:radical SAM protein with 4Fe4S-binding SPASM domain
MNKSRLKEIKIEVTQKCPLNCLHCSSESNISKTLELTESQVSSVIDEASELGVEEIVFSGGEPLIWSHLPEMIKKSHNYSIHGVVYTTGIPLINQDDLLNKLLAYGLKKTVVSIFGATASSHEFITRTSGSFSGTIRAIDAMVSKNIDVDIHFVAMSPNWKQLSNVISLAESLGVNKVSVLRFVPHGRGSMVKDLFNLNKTELVNLRQEIINCRSKYKTISIRLGSPFNILLINEDVDCLAAINRLIIGPDGKIFPCDAFKNVDYDEGKFSSLNDGSLTEIWDNSDYLKRIREDLSKGLGPKCRSCTVNAMCKGGCLAQKIIRNGNSSYPDPDCLTQGRELK